MPPSILTLDQFLKQQGWVATGGHAKFVIQEGEVTVNGEIDTRRGRKMRIGDLVEWNGEAATVPEGSGALPTDPPAGDPTTNS
ncbi:MAG: RNA-binding protein [Planctomyces sp.]|nr:RNA-binding protein [Planctomyces sp.]